MKTMKSIFWNTDENRLRAGWRLLIHLIIFLFFTVGQDALNTTYGALPAAGVFINLLYLASGLGSTWLIARFIDRRSFSDFGFHFDRKWWLDLGFGLALGAFMMTGIFLMMKTLGWLVITGPASTNYGVPIVLAFLLRVVKHFVVSVNEELAFRGYQLKNLSEGFSHKRMGPRGAILLTFLASSTLFGMMHLANGNATVFSMLTTICAGLLFCLPFLLTGELGVPIGFHLTWNLFLATVYGFALSGAAQGTRLISIQITGPDAWTGGAYGPEVGLISLVWALAGCGLIFLWNKWLRGRVELHLALARYSPSKDSL